MQTSTFDTVLKSIDNSIAVEKEWANGTGYFDGAVAGAKLQPGERAKGIDEHGRNLIFIGTRFGTVVFFERFSRPEGAENIAVVSNIPKELTGFITSGNIPGDEFARYSNFDDANIGRAVERLFK